jgi:CO/xanthine dehydrogenase FAD-binding subunit
MKRIKPFRYLEPETVSEAIGMLVREGKGAYPLAGGTDLLVRMKRGDARPVALVNLKRLPGLGGIERREGKNLHIGALARVGELERSEIVRESHPLLGEAAGVLGSAPIRNLATVGGNIGRASPASDLAPSLMVLGAKVCIEGSGGKRDMEVRDFFKGPGVGVLSPGELILSFYVPGMEEGSRAAYLRLGRREGMDCALVGVAVRVSFSGADSGLREARVALGAVGPTPLRARRAEEELLSGSFTEERVRAAARLAMEECLPISDIRTSGEYRREMVGVLTRRALERVRRDTQGERR